MRSVLIYSECHLHHSVMQYIFRKDFFNVSIENLNVVGVKKQNNYKSISSADLIMLFIDDSTILQYTEFYFKELANYPHVKIICIGRKNCVSFFRKMTGIKSTWLNITSSIDEIIAGIEITFSEKALSRYLVKGEAILTTAEIEVASMLSTGLTLTDIAKIKGKSIKTVSGQKCSFFRKLGLKNSAGNFIGLTNIVSG